MKQDKSFKVGDKVKIRKSSNLYGDGDTNPADTVGVITKDDRAGDWAYEVKWPCGGTNTYRAKDLELVGLEVSEDFLREAHKAACSTWKAKIEEQFPEVFKSPYAKVTDEAGIASLEPEMYLRTTDKKYVRANFDIIWGIAGNKGVPENSKARGLYFSSRRCIKPVVQEVVGGGYTVLFESI